MESNSTIDWHKCGQFATEPTLRVVVGITFTFVTVVGIGLNALVVGAYWLNSAALLRQPQDYLIMLNALSDCIYSLGCHTIELVDHIILQCTPMGTPLCFVQNLFDWWGWLQSMINVALISVDRLLMLLLGATYAYHVTPRRVVSVWLCTAALSVVHFLVPEIYALATLDEYHNDVMYWCLTEFLQIPLLAVVIINTDFWLPWAFVVGTSVVIVWKLQSRATRLLYMNGGSEAGMEAKRIRRTMLILAGLDLVLLLSFGPTGVVYVHDYISSGSLLEGTVYRRLIFYLAYSNTALNPLVYLALLPKLRKAILPLLFCSKDRTAVVNPSQAYA